MNWITTNIRFPKDVYMEVKMEAAEKRKSFAQIVRERVSKKKEPKKINVEKVIRELDKLAKETARQNPGINFTEKLIEMRYEQ